MWSWLLGPFALAHHACTAMPSTRSDCCGAIAPHLDDACVGQISEIFDAEAPHTPGGCFAQAWGVAETLRAYDFLNAARANSTQTIRKTHHG